MSAVQGVNLISPARRSARLRRQRITRWSGGLVAYGVVLALVWLGAHVDGTGADRSVAAELAETRREIERATDRIQTLRPELTESRNVLAASRAVGNQPDWSLLLSLLSGLLDERTVLTECRLETSGHEPWASGASRHHRADAQQTARGPYRLHLTGFGESHAVVQAYLLRLERTGLFETVTLVDTQTASFRDDEAVRFRIECRLGVPIDADDDTGPDTQAQAETEPVPPADAEPEPGAPSEDDTLDLPPAVHPQPQTTP